MPILLSYILPIKKGFADPKNRIINQIKIALEKTALCQDFNRFFGFLESKTDNGKRKKNEPANNWAKGLGKVGKIKSNHLVAHSKSLQKQTCAIGSKINGLCTGWCINT